MAKKLGNATKRVDKSSVVIGFGTRAVSSQNFSKIVALPKQALTNIGHNVERVNVELVQEKDAKFIRLTATKSGGERA